MPLIDMLTDIKSFNYNKVGQKHDEYFGEDNATGFTPTRETGDKTEFIVGSGNDFNFKTSSTGVDYFYNTHAVGFTISKEHKGTSDFVGMGDLTFDGKTSLYGDIESNVLGTDDDYDGIRDTSPPKIKSKPDLKILNVDYKKVAKSKESVEPGINKGDVQPKESSEYVSKVPNKPLIPMFSEDHPYGALPDKKEFKDIDGDTYDAPYEITDEYIKFGGNAGLRGGTYDSNANKGVFGSDSPYIIKEIGDRYDSLDWVVDSAITILPFKIVRTVEDVIRIGKWNLTAKGLMWNANQFLLTAQNARGENRIFNPLGPLGSLIPYVNLPRHTKGNFTDFREPPSYPKTKPQDQEANVEKKSLFDKILGRGSAALGVQLPDENKLDELRKTRIVDGEGSNDDPGPLSALGLFQTAWTDPKHQHKSMKGPFGGDLGDDGNLLTTYADLTAFGRSIDGKEMAPSTTGPGGDKLTEGGGHGQSGFVFKADSSTDKKLNFLPEGGSLNFTPENDVATEEFGYTQMRDQRVGTGYVADKKKADEFNLGKSKIKTGEGGLYSVGVSNQLQVAYGGKFGDLGYAVGTPDNTLPKDFIKFKIRDAVNGKWLIFPAHLGAITDTVTPEWAKEAYIGRPDEVHIYTKTSRTVGLTFKVAAFSKQEIPIIQEKMNYLMGLGYPTFKKMIPNDVEERPDAPYIYLTVGDLYNNTPGYFDNISISTEDNTTWEIDEGFQIPQFFNVSVNFVYVGRYLPQTVGKHYDVPWLTDSGAGSGNYGTFGTNDPKNGSTSSPDRTSAGVDVGWAKTL